MRGSVKGNSRPVYTGYGLAILLCFSLCFSTAARSETDRVYSVGIVPQFEISRLHSIWRPVLNHLEEQTGFKFKIQGSPSIPDFEKALLAGEFDFAYMNPYHMVLANQAADYHPIIRDHGRKLQGVLVVRKDSPITDIKQLDGKSAAFPSPNALGASLLMRAELSNRHGVTIKPRYVKTHDSVYMNVVLGQTDAGGGVQKTLGKQKASVKDRLRVLYRTEKVEPHPLAAHPRINKNTVSQIQKALVDLGQTSSGQKLLSNIPVKKIGLASMDDYLALKQMELDKFSAGQ